MKRHGALVLFLVAFAATSGHVEAQAPPTKYDQLVDRLKVGDRTVDFTEARLAFTETPAYNGRMMVFYRQLWGALNMRDFEGALAIADKALQLSYVEPNAHMVAALAHRELGHPDLERLHRFIADGLLQSIASRGDGKTQETAYQVIDISEEYALFRSMNLTPKGQAAGPAGADGRIVDRTTVVDRRTSEERVMFFSVDNPDAVKKRHEVQPR